jgi:outer membrane protein assembly factor BamB
MKRFSGGVLALALLAGAVRLYGEEAAKSKSGDEAKPAEAVDIVKDARRWNSNEFVAPPTEFRKGKATPRKLDPKAVVKAGDGFTVSLPSNAPILTPTVYQGNVYVSGGFHSKEFYCLKGDTGELVWGVDLDDDGPSSAVCEDGVVVFNTESCTIFALEAKTGKQMWSYFLGDPLTSTPTIANGVVFTSYPAAGRGAEQNDADPAPPQDDVKQPREKPKKEAKAKSAPPCSHVLAAFDLKTGKILWQRWLDSDVMSAPVASGDELYVASFSGVVYKLKQKDGEILSAVKSRATSAPVVVGDNVYWTRRTDDGKGDAKEAVAGHDRAEQKEVFRSKERKAEYIDKKVQEGAKLAKDGKDLDAGNGFAGGAAPAAANPMPAADNVGQGNVSTMQAFQGSRILHLAGNNINCMGDEVVCTDPTTGKGVWTYKIDGDLKKEGGFLAAPPAAAGGFLFLVTLKGDVLQMDPKEGKVVKTWKVGAEVRAQPAVENGKIYLGTQTGKVVCIDTGDEKFTGWPCWGGNAAHTGLPKAAK